MINRGFNGIISGNYDEDYDSLWNSVYNGTGSSGSYTSSSALSSSSTSTKKEEEKDSNKSSIKDPDKLNDWADITKNNTDSDKKKSDSKKNTTSSLKLKADPLPTGKGGFGELNGATFVDQNDPSLKNVDYSDPRSSVKDTFGDAGCAPAALSMALGNIGIKEDPLSIAKTAQISGYRDETGTNAEFISNYLGSNGVNVVESEVPSSDFIDSSLDTGRSVILSGVRGMNENKNDSPYTSAGHYVTVVGKDNNGNYIVNDPRGKQYSKKYSKNSVLSSATSGWSLGDAASIGGFGERIRSKRKKKIGGYGDQKALGMAIVYWMFTVLDRLWYTNGGERYNIEAGINGTGSGDCSSTARWAVLKASGNQVDIGTYTGAQWNNLL